MGRSGDGSETGLRRRGGNLRPVTVPASTRRIGIVKRLQLNWVVILDTNDVHVN